MAQQHQVIGIIEVPDRVGSGWLSNLQRIQAIVRLRDDTLGSTTGFPPADYRRHWDSSARRSTSCTVISADLGQLQADLRSELGEIVDRLRSTA